MDFEQLFIRMGLPAKFVGDITLILLLIVASIIFGVFMGRSRLSNFLINVYIAFGLAVIVPDQFVTDPSMRGWIFLGTVVVLNIIALSLFDIHIPGSAPSILGRMLLLSLLEVGLFLSILISFLPQKEVLRYISKTAYTDFASPNARLFWMVAPLVFLFIINKKYSR